MNKILIVACLFFAAFNTTAQQKVIQLYNGTAPGSENWTYNEQVHKPGTEGALAYNVPIPPLRYIRQILQRQRELQ